MDHFLRHFEHVINLVGIDHVALGLDYFTHMAGAVTDEEAMTYYQDSIRVGRWLTGELSASAL